MDKPLEITVFIGLDEVSNVALNNLVKACNLLNEKFNVKVFVNPINLWHDPINSSIRGLPIIVIGNKKIFSGYPPDVDELVKEVLKVIRSNKGSVTEDPLPFTHFEGGFLSAAIAD
jgi:hypothetical protein|uniref:Thioredoxin-like fold domain-containing protein n=1 Tax=Ignisphaera aggregans TaxID=334771 RepID=A0A7J2U488_9CREN